jgi:flagellar basal body rod protein FlgG
MEVASLFRTLSHRWLQFNLRQLLMATFLVGLACWWLFHRPHGVQKTGRDLDVAIFGRGYFVATDIITNATVYSRYGHLLVNANGQLHLGNDRFVEPNITIPPEALSVSIATDGNVYYYTQGQTLASSAGQLQLATFINPEGLKEYLPNLFEQADDSGQPQANIPGTNGAGLLQSGYLESPEGQRVEATTLLLVGLCSLVGWLAWEVRSLRLSLAK